MRLCVFLLAAGIAAAHPMGNFSVNHYARLEPGEKGLLVTYVLDLAELPTGELIQSWGVDRNAPRADMEEQARLQARQWASNLTLTEDGKRLLGVLQSSRLDVEEGVGGLPVYRISADILFLAKGGRIEFEDGNYTTRTGWRELVIRPGKGAGLKRASVVAEDRSRGLTEYPKDQESAPPQVSKGWLEWSPIALPAVETAQTVKTKVAAPVEPARAVQGPRETGAAPVEPGRAVPTAALLLLLAAGLYLLRYILSLDGIRRLDRSRVHSGVGRGNA